MQHFVLGVYAWIGNPFFSSSARKCMTEMTLLSALYTVIYSAQAVIRSICVFILDSCINGIMEYQITHPLKYKQEEGSLEELYALKPAQ